TGDTVDLVSSGGHDVQFPGRRIFPLRFISRHYPIRGAAHGARKVFAERTGRFRSEERARGWHVQYDGVNEGSSFIRDPSTLTPYDPDAVRIALTIRHRGVEALESAVDEARCLADVSRRQLEAHQRDLDAHRAELERCAAWARSLEAELTRKNGLVAEGDRALAERVAALAKADARLAIVEAESAERARALAAASELAAHQSRAIADLEARSGERQRRVDDLERSLSWRLTAPGRGVLGGLTRGHR